MSTFGLSSATAIAQWLGTFVRKFSEAFQAYPAQAHYALVTSRPPPPEPSDLCRQYLNASEVPPDKVEQWWALHRQWSEQMRNWVEEDSTYFKNLNSLCVSDQYPLLVQFATVSSTYPSP